MLFPIKGIIAKYRTLVVKMNDNLHIVIVVNTNLQYFYDIEVVMRLTCIMFLWR
jgi:hypothetical protein